MSSRLCWLMVFLLVAAAPLVAGEAIHGGRGRAMDGHSVLYPAGACDVARTRSAHPLADTTPPTSIVTSAPLYANAGPIAIEWVASDDESGVAQTCLWYKVGSAGTWSESAECVAGTFGTFDFAPLDGDGTYYFETVAEDTAGNAEVGPEGDGEDYTVYDTQSPASIAIAVPERTVRSTFDVSWHADDVLSGVISFTVEYSETQYAGWQTFTTTSSLSDTFTAPYTETTYLFQVTAYDRAGNSGTAMAETFVGQSRLYLPLVFKNYDPFTNGSFEQELMGWRQIEVPLPVGIVSTVKERPSGSMAPSDGGHALLLGHPDYPCGSVPLGYAAVEQTFVVPENASSITFDYIIWTQDSHAISSGYDRFEVYVNGWLVFSDGNELNQGLSCDTWRRVPGPGNPREEVTSGWATAVIDVTGYRGQAISLSFRNYSRFDNWYNTYTYVDNVQLEME